MISQRLTAEELREKFEFNKENGEWSRKYDLKFGPDRKHVGSLSTNGYWQIKFGRKVYSAHRLAWLYVHGEWPNGEIDHINGIKTDNRICNLRIASSSLNKQNRRKPKSNNSTGFLGVSFDKRRRAYVAQISVNGKSMHLGQWETPEKAHDAYVSAKRQYHTGCTI